MSSEERWELIPVYVHGFKTSKGAINTYYYALAEIDVNSIGNKAAPKLRAASNLADRQLRILPPDPPTMLSAPTYRRVDGCEYMIVLFDELYSLYAR